MRPEEINAIRDALSQALAPMLLELEAIRVQLTRPHSTAIAYRAVAVAASRSENVNISGNFFLVYSASGAFSVQFDDDEKFACKVGMTVTVPDGFQKITIFNDTSDINTVEFWASNTPIAWAGNILLGA